jgi:drug/metabolite transporter (DMT)-like permease
MIQSHLGESAALLVAVLWTFSALSFEFATKIVGSLAVNIFRLVIAFVFLCAYCYVFKGTLIPTDATAHQWIWLSLSGLVGFVFGDLCLFKSFALIGSRFAMLVMTLAPPLAALAGWLVLNETLTIYSILGIFLTIFGIALAVFSHNPGQEKFKLNMPVKGFLYAIGGAMGQAFGLVLSKIGMQGYDDAFASTQIRAITGIIGFAIIIYFMKRVPQTIRTVLSGKAMTGITIGAIFGPFLGVAFSLYAVNHTETGIAATIMQTTPILIIPASFFLFKQKITLKEIAGAIISVAGVALFFVK